MVGDLSAIEIERGSGWRLPLLLSAMIAFGIAAGCTRAVAPPTQQTLMVAEAPNTPLSLKLIKELYNGDSLLVHSTISGAVGWDRASVRGRLRLYREGELLTSVERSLGEGSVPPGEEVPLLIEVPILASNATGFTDYQLELVWGQVPREAGVSLSQAQALSESSVSSSAILKVSALSSQPITDGCSATICGLLLRGNLSNQGQQVVESAHLQVGFRRKELGTLTDAVVPLREELSLAGVNLAPGEVQPFEIKFEEVEPLFEEILRGNLEPFSEIQGSP